jgi:hypothetical protein
MKPRIAFLAVISAMLASPAIAAQWLSVWRDFDSVDQHAYEVLLDESSIRVKAAQPNTRTATVKYVRSAPGFQGSPVGRIAFSITFKSFKCDARRIRLDASEVHFPDGSMQYVDTPRDESSWHTAKDPATRQILNIVCAVKNPES